MPDDDLVERYLVEFMKTVDLEEQSKEEYAALALLNSIWVQMTPAQHEEILQILGSEPPWDHRKKASLPS